MMSEPVVYSAAGGVIVDETGTQVLVLVRPTRDEIRLPKGHVEPGEAPLTTAYREVSEESGYTDLELVADLGEQLVVFMLQDRPVQRTEHYYLMRLRSHQESARPDGDATQFFSVWVSWDEALANLTFEAEREWLRRARQHLELRP
jgi:8-oxo-dGTP pyrophosphatase MutT (NUDIX family)